MRTLGVLSVLAAFSWLGCVGSSTPTDTVPTSTAAPTASTAAVDPDAANAPFPYTAAQIREASKPGRVITFLVEKPGKPAFKQRFRFAAADAEAATIAAEVVDDSGKVIGEPDVKISTWEQLRRHATYPKATTSITEVDAETLAGPYKCKRYTATETTPEGLKKTVACFANDLPGPPIELTIELDGKLVMTMALVKNEPGSAD